MDIVGTMTARAEANDRTNKAFRAVARFRELLPVLNSYARHLTGRDDVRIELSTTSNGMTDGTVIYLRPPIALGDYVAHNISLCDRRDKNLKQKCPSCHQRESVLIVIYHEIAHIVGESFKRPASRDVERIFADAVRASGTASAKRARSKLIAHRWTSYVEMSRVLNEWLGYVVNVLEDARIDHEMFRSLPGTRVMYRSLLNQLKLNGIEVSGAGDTPTNLKWSDQPLNAQAIFALYFIYAKYSAEGWFHAAIDAVLDDEILQGLIAKSRKSTSIKDVYRISFPVLERLRELGFCKLPEDEESGGEDGGGSDPGATGDGPSSSDAGSSSSKGSSDGDEPGETTSSTDGQSDSDGTDKDLPEGGEEHSSSEDERPSEDHRNSDRGHESVSDSEGAQEESEEVDEGSSDSVGNSIGKGEGTSPDGEGDSSDEAFGNEAVIPDPGTPEEIKDVITRGAGHDEEYTIAVILPGSSESGTPSGRLDDKAVIVAIVQSAYFDEPSEQIQGVEVFTYPRDSYRGVWSGSGESDIQVPENILGNALLRMRAAFAPNAARGMERNRKSGRISNGSLAKRAPFEDPRMMQKRLRVTKRDHFVLIGLDISGSTASGITGGGNRLGLIKKAAAAQATLCHRMGLKFAVYAHTGGYGRGSSTGMTFQIYVIKDPQEPWNATTQARLAKLRPGEANLDGHTMEFYRKALDRRPETDRILMYYTDGAMPAENYHEELAILRREVRICKYRGHTLMAVGVLSDDSSKHGLDTVRLDRVEDVIRVVEHLEKRLRERVG